MLKYLWITSLNEAELRYNLNNSELKFISEVLSLNSHEKLGDYIRKNKLITVFSEFEFYLSECFRFILMKYPTILSNKTIEVKRFFKSDSSVNIIIAEIIDREIHDIFYNDYVVIFDKATKMSIKHNISSDELNKLHKFKQLRNIYIHGNGIVTHNYQYKIQNFDSEIGTKIELTDKLLNQIRLIVDSVVLSFDHSLTTHFPELIQNEVKEEE